MTRTLKVKNRSRREGGYAVVLTALVLVPLMGFAGFAIDVGSWYSKAAQVGRAADAAALAGVVWMPDFTRAETEALAEAARNGFVDDGIPGSGIDITVAPGGSNQLEVVITDHDIDLYFSGLFVDEVDITRNALAEYAGPIPLGSPNNYIGAGDQGTDPSYAWAGMMGHCTTGAHGDLLSIRYSDGGTRAENNAGNCGTVESDYYYPAGYRWVIEVPAGTVGNAEVQVYDGGFCSAAQEGRPTERRRADLRFTLWDKDDTPLSNQDNVTSGTRLGSPKVYAVDEGCGAWTTAFVIDEGPGTYVLTSETVDIDGGQDFVPNQGNAGNYFGLRVTAGTHSGYCTTLGGDTTCPRIYADEWLPVRTEPPEVDSFSTFYLAEVGRQYAGQTMVISMWDLGEGMESVEILDPTGAAMPGSWQIVDQSISGKAHRLPGDATGTMTAVQGGTTCQLSGYCLFVTNDAFDGSLVNVTVQLPSEAEYDLMAAAGIEPWFSVRYAEATNSVDWTTWSVSVVGDPVRLVE